VKSQFTLNGSEFMNKLKQYLVSIFLIALLINTAYGFAGMTANNATTPQEVGPARQMDLNNTTASDQDIILVQHLIEVDAVQLQPENKLFIKETLIFRNIGTKDFFGSLKTWIPDGGENIRLNRSEMMTTGELITLPYTKNGNIISWQDYVEQNSTLPFLYVVEYDVKKETGGALSETERFSKKLAYPTLINYRYLEKSGLTAIVVKITKPADSSVKFLDENGNAITPTASEENGTINRFSTPKFKEINVELSKSSAIAGGTQGYAVYLVLGILIILVLLYPVITKKLKQRKNSEEKEETSEPSGKIPEKKSGSVDSSIPSGEGFKGKSKTELENLRTEFQLKLKELDTQYKSGNLLDEEYEDSRNKYQEKLNSINARLK
jgi:hypothetical protein